MDLLLGTATTAATAGSVTTVTSANITSGLGYTPANIASPTFTGLPKAPTAAAGTNTTQLATTAFVTALGELKAPINAPVFTAFAQFTGGIGVTGATSSIRISGWDGVAGDGLLFFWHREQLHP